MVIQIIFKETLYTLSEAIISFLIALVSCNLKLPIYRHRCV